MLRQKTPRLGWTRLRALLSLATSLAAGCGEDLEIGEVRADSQRAHEPVPVDLSEPRTAEGILKQREALNRTLWKDEVEAQRYERVITEMWDRLRAADDPFEVLANFPFEKLHTVQKIEGGFGNDGTFYAGYSAANLPPPLDQGGWKTLLFKYRDEGYVIETTEWHHVEFQPAEKVSDGRPRSQVAFKINVARSEPPQRIVVYGKLKVYWDGLNPPRAREIYPTGFFTRSRSAAPVFEEILAAESSPAQPRLLPLIVRDLDGDGLPEIVAGGSNKRWRNLGGGKFEEEPLVPGGLDIFDSGIIADFTGDGRGDLVAVSRDHRPRIWPADASGQFTLPSRPCAEFLLEFPRVFTAGDIDGDGDLDLFIGQYKFPYIDGAMPTPLYDSNDGHPAVLLINDGGGRFADITKAAGLGTKRHRRTHSASLFDHDGDGDLDLLTVNDFAGLDFYLNDGKGVFTDATEDTFDERSLFGMAHAFGDFNRDGEVDLYAVGRSSTTVKRLRSMGLARKDRPDITRMREAMTSGTRMYYKAGGRFVQPKHTVNSRRTEWAWGISAADFNLDGNLDLYIANGHSSGRSSTDYSTQYWRHDVYTGSSKPDTEIDEALGSSQTALNAGEISWNGYEKNVLLSTGTGDVAHLFGVAFEADSRGVVATDLDADGRPDLLLVTVRIEGKGSKRYELTALRNTLDAKGERWVDRPPKPGEKASPGSTQVFRKRHWIGVRLKPGKDGRSPLGATVIVRTDSSGQQDPTNARINHSRWDNPGKYVQAKPIVTGDSFSSQHPLVAHFGLGQYPTTAEVEIRWPGGERTLLKDLEVDRYHDVTR